jgi:transposase
MAATIRVPSEHSPGLRMAETRMFATTRAGVTGLADWLRSWQVPAVAMEATSDYWKPVYYRLEAMDLECVLADARQVRNLPGRPKRDTSDSAWIAACFERGAIRPCFVATPEFRVIREHTRYRRDLTADQSRDKNRTEKLLESAGIKISSVLSDLHGVTGRDIMDHLIAGERDPKALAALARGRARARAGQLEQALDGTEFFTAELAGLLAVMLGRIDRAGQEIARLSQVIEDLLAPYEDQLQQAESIPGWGRRSAQDVLAETGTDMTRFADGAHLASWAGRTPLERQSGARRGRSRRRHGNRYLGGTLGETAVAAGRTETRIGVRHRRITRRRGAAKACVATGNTQMRILHALLSAPGTRYEDLGTGWYDDARQHARQVSHHIGKLASLGYEVTLCRRPGPDQAPAGS